MEALVIGGDVALTTSHSSSSYGIPVLVVGGTAYGSADHVPRFGKTAGEYILAFLANEMTGLEKDEVEFIRRFLDRVKEAMKGGIV